MTSLRQEGTTSIKKLLAYSKPANIEVRCLTCHTQQIGIVGDKRHFCSYLSFVIRIDRIKIHKKLTSGKFDM